MDFRSHCRYRAFVLGSLPSGRQGHQGLRMPPSLGGIVYARYASRTSKNVEESTMQQGAVAVRDIRYTVLLLICCLCVPVGLVQAKGSSTRADVAELLKKHDDALNQHNLSGLLALYSPSPKTVILGTGPGEKYQGKDEIKAAYTEIFKDFDKGT